MPHAAADHLVMIQNCSRADRHEGHAYNPTIFHVAPSSNLATRVERGSSYRRFLDQLCR